MTARRAASHWTGGLLRSASMARAFTLAAMAAILSSQAIEDLAGLVTYVTIIAGLCALGAGMLVARRRELSLLRLVPLTLLVLLCWTGVSIFWSSSPADTAIGWVSQLGIAFLAVVVVHVRDTLQMVRALGDVMRWLLSISLGLEILVGILLRNPVTLLTIQGNIVALGPVQGIFITRNMLGFVAVLALITFMIEWRTASVRPGLAVFSVSLAGVLAALSKSPTVLVLAVAMGAATGALMLVRHAHPRNRTAMQWTLGSLVTVGVIAAYFWRHQIIAWIGAGTDFSVRADLWRVLSVYVRFYPVQGFGWFGSWPDYTYPFAGIDATLGSHNTTALNAYADLVLQVGWVGLFLFAAMSGIAVVRAWLAASERRSVVYAWTPLILVALGTISLFESFVLFGAGWFVLVLCLINAGQSRSWRERMEPEAEPTL